MPRLNIRPTNLRYQQDGQTYTEEEISIKNLTGLFVFDAPGMGPGYALVESMPNLFRLRNAETLDVTMRAYLEMISLFSAKLFDRESINLDAEKFTIKYKYIREIIAQKLNPKNTSFIEKLFDCHIPQALITFKNLDVDEKKKIYQKLLTAGASKEATIYACLADKSLLKLAVPYAKEQITDYDLLHGITPIFQILNGSLSNSEFNLVKLFLQNGCNPNLQHPQFGTILHVWMANESTVTVLKLIDLIETYSQHPFDYNAKDAEGKTILNIAAKVRSGEVIKKIIQLKKMGKQIDLDLLDSQYRTAISITAALGDFESFKLLLDANASLYYTDKNSRGIGWYACAPPSEVAQILQDIHIEPLRHFQAPHNWLYFNDALARTITCNESQHKDGLVLISGQGKDGELLAKIKKQVSKEPSQCEFYSYIERQTTDLFIFPERTMLAHCLEGQQRVFSMLELHLKQNPMLAKEMMQFGLVSAYRYKDIHEQQATLCLSKITGLSFRPLLRDEKDDIIVDAVIELESLSKQIVSTLKENLERSGITCQLGFAFDKPHLLVRETNHSEMGKRLAILENLYTKCQSMDSSKPSSEILYHHTTDKPKTAKVQLVQESEDQIVFNDKKKFNFR